MLNGLVILGIFIMFSGFEMLLHISRFLRPERIFESNERYFKGAAHRIFNLMRAYRSVRIECENLSGRDLPERFLLIANHQSLMDIPLLIDLFPARKLRFVAKRELGKGVPFVSSILRAQGHALIARDGEASQAMRSILRFTRLCEREGTCPVIFPEGTRSRDGEVGVFHTAGVRKILAETPLPIVVAVIEGGWRIARLSGVILHLRGVRYRVRILSVTPPLRAKREVLDAVSKAREDIVLALAEMRDTERAGANKARPSSTMAS
jgi:1-acyl-sn-glycerol-3-phosphate acyltransferase